MTAWLLLAFLVIAGLLLLFRGDIQVLSIVDHTGFEPVASSMPWRRSTK